MASRYSYHASADDTLNDVVAHLISGGGGSPALPAAYTPNANGAELSVSLASGFSFEGLQQNVLVAGQVTNTQRRFGPRRH